jgi:hypothetical protein
MSAAPRDRGVDAARGLAMVLMTSTHALRILHPRRMPEIGEWLLRIEPVIPMLFFVVGGWSLARSRRNAADPAAWRRRHLLRALGLWVLSMGMFFVYSGPQWPEILVSSGVLGCFAASVAIAVAFSGSAAAGTTVFVASLVAWLALWNRGIRIDGLDNGTFPLLPYMPVFLGAYLLESPLKSRRWMNSALGTLAALWVLALSIQPGFRELWGEWGVTQTFQDYFRTARHDLNGFALSWDLFQGLPALPRQVGFWYPLPSLVPVAVSLAGLCVLFFSSIADRFPGRLRPLSILGRLSLPYYVGHLVFLGAVGAVLPPSAASSSWTWLVATLAAAGICLAIGILRETRGAQP